MQQIIKRNRKTVQLTSLLDLLFVMIFLSLLQTKTPPPKAVEKAKERPVQEKAVARAENSVTATFHFYATKNNPQVPTGTYEMVGVFEKETGEISFRGVSWIKRPELYDMVPLNGKIDSKLEVFTGRIEHPGCLVFKLYREAGASGSEIAGSWKGVYSCGQGETGLTLTIK